MREAILWFIIVYVVVWCIALYNTDAKLKAKIKDKSRREKIIVLLAIVRDKHKIMYKDSDLEDVVDDIKAESADLIQQAKAQWAEVVQDMKAEATKVVAKAKAEVAKAKATSTKKAPARKPATTKKAPASKSGTKVNPWEGKSPRGGKAKTVAKKK